MSTTVGQLFLDARALLDEYSEDGVLIPDDEIIDLQKKFIRFADMAQKELFKVGKYYKPFEFANKPAPNLLGLLSNFDIVDYVGDVQYYPNSAGVAGAKAYYFEADGEGTVTIEENQSGTWVALVTVDVPNTITSLTAFKGILSPLSTTNPIRMKFAGTSHYRHANRCLYSFPFASGKVPDYRPWFKVTMPADFRSVDQIVEEFPSRQYAKSANYKWEGFKDLYVNYYYEGNVRIVYKPVPADITALTDVLSIDDITARAITYYGAARLAAFKKKELVNYFEQKFAELKIESTSDMPASAETIIDVYSLGGEN